MVFKSSKFVGISESCAHIIKSSTAFIIRHLVGNRRHTTVVATLLALQANHLDHLCPEADGRVNESRFVSIDHWALPDQIGLLRLDELGPLDDLPEDEKERRKNKHGVIGEKVRNVESTAE